LTKLLDEVRQKMKSLDLEEVQVWIKDEMGNREINKVSIDVLEMIDDDMEWGLEEDDDDFGTINLDLPPLPPLEKPICKKPWQHHFARKLMLNLYYHECTRCGYSPDYDWDKPRFLACHAAYVAHKKTE